MVKEKGYFIALKANIEEELENSKEMIKKLNSSIEKIETFNLPIEHSIRNLVKIKKESKTNSIYPRRMDKIKNEI